MKSGTSRRRFFWKAGAALAAPLAATGAAHAGGDDVGALRARLALLEDLEALRALNRTFARHVAAGEREQAERLFADPATAVVDARLTGVSADVDAERDAIVLGDGLQSATARLPCTVQIETPLEPCPLVEMARAQGGGVVRRLEAGILENVYVKHGGVWKIARSSYRPA